MLHYCVNITSLYVLLLRKISPANNNVDDDNYDDDGNNNNNNNSGARPPHYWSLEITDTPHSVGLFWTDDQPVAETSTWQQTTLTTDRYPCSRQDSNPQPQQASGRRPTSYTARQLGGKKTCISMAEDLYRVVTRCPSVPWSLGQDVPQRILVPLCQTTRRHIQNDSPPGEPHLSLYVQSNRYTILLYNRIYSRISALYSVSDLTGPSSGAYQAVFAGLVNGDSRTVSCFWPLRCCRKNAVLPTTLSETL
jgi:hypothetical protein